MKPQILTQNLLIKEIFQSLQGEGGRAGENSIFIRLANCNLNCWFCDTNWNDGEPLTLEEIYEKIKNYKSKWIVWTGGEPSLQLTSEIVNYFKAYGYKQAIETNGTNPVPSNLDYIVCSPKVSVHILKQNFPDGLDEIRIPVQINQPIPPIDLLPPAKHYYLSPVFLGKEKERFNINNLNYCINYIMEHPEWKISIQQHKIWNVR